MIKRITRGFNRIYSEKVNSFKSWKTNKKIIVIESDDWGSIRMPNYEVYKNYLNNNFKVNKCNYMKYDSLASPDDLNELFKVLRKYKDSNGSHPKFTANTIVANPDFNKIKENNYKEFYYESFLDTLNKYNYTSFDLWLEGMDAELFHPQFHGREHLNVSRWIHYLHINNEDFLFSFNNNAFGLSKSVAKKPIKSVMAAFDTENRDDISNLATILESGLNLFEDIFNYKSKSFIPPNYIFPIELEKILSENGVRYIQSNALIKDNLNGDRNVFLGERNDNDQIYLTRNCVFEPSVNLKEDWVNKTLKDIDKAFKNNSPAIICSHRVNFIGGVVEENRNSSLKQLDSLLNEILNRWSDVEFMSSDELGELINNDI